MNQILAGYADECEKAEYQFVELWFRGTYGPSRWEARTQGDAEVVIRYPDTFDVTPFAESSSRRRRRSRSRCRRAS
jgi:hypothetical protein